jgi:hypothetical protein
LAIFLVVEKAKNWSKKWGQKFGVKNLGSKIWGQKFAVIKSVSHDVMHFLFRQLSVSGQSHLGVFPSDGRLLTGTAHLVSERDPVRMLTQRRPMSW